MLSSSTTSEEGSSSKGLGSWEGVRSKESEVGEVQMRREEKGL